MAYTLLDAAYAMYYPEAEFAEGKGGLKRRAKAAGLRGLRMAKRGGRAAMRNKGKLALAGAGLAGLGLANRLRQRAVANNLASQPGMARTMQVMKSRK